MKRIIVLGGSGFFGHLIVERLRAAGMEPISASRSSGEMRIDANNPDDIRNNVKPRDLVVDAAGPFQKRNAALIDSAMKIGFDVIDLSDSAAYTSMIHERELPIGAAGIRVLTACSSLSTLSALVVKSIGIDEPRKVSAYLLPAYRQTANAGAVESFLASIEGNVRTLRFPNPIGKRSGITVKSVDSVTLPRVFPSVRVAELIVDTGHTTGNALIQFAFVREMIGRYQSQALKIARRIGPTSGILGYEVSSTLRHRQQVFTGERSHMLAVLPAILAATAIAGGRFPHRGLVPPDKHVEAGEFFDFVRREGITITT